MKLMTQKKNMKQKKWTRQIGFIKRLKCWLISNKAEPGKKGKNKTQVCRHDLVVKSP